MIQTLNLTSEHIPKFCLMLLKQPKKSYYNGLILNSNNKIKTTWNIIKTITGKRPNNTEVQFLYISKKN
jgi:hypothetical protein